MYVFIYICIHTHKPCDHSRDQQEEERLLFFCPGKYSANEMKNHGLFVYYSPPNFLFPSIEEFSLPCCVGTWLTKFADPELQVSADPE